MSRSCRVYLAASATNSPTTVSTDLLQLTRCVSFKSIADSESTASLVRERSGSSPASGSLPPDRSSRTFGAIDRYVADCDAFASSQQFEAGLDHLPAPVVRNETRPPTPEAFTAAIMAPCSERETVTVKTIPMRTAVVR